MIFRTAGEKSPVDPALSPETKARFVAREERARELHLQDRSAIYGMFHLYEMVGGNKVGGDKVGGEMVEGQAAS